MPINIFLSIIIVCAVWFLLWWRTPKNAQSAYKAYMDAGNAPIKKFTYARRGNQYEVYAVNENHTLTKSMSSDVYDLLGNKVEEPTFAITKRTNGFDVDGITHKFNCPTDYLWNGTRCEEKPKCNNESGKLKRYLNYARGFIKCKEGTNFEIGYCSGYTLFNGTKCAPYDPCVDMVQNQTHNVGITEVGQYFRCQGNTSVAAKCPENSIYVPEVGCTPLNQCQGIADGTKVKINNTTFATCLNGAVGRVTTCRAGTNLNDSNNCEELCSQRVTEWFSNEFFHIPKSGVSCPENKVITCGSDQKHLDSYNPDFPLDAQYWNQAFVNGKCEETKPEQFLIKKQIVYTFPPLVDTLPWDVMTNRPVKKVDYFSIGGNVVDWFGSIIYPMNQVIPLIASDIPPVILEGLPYKTADLVNSTKGDFVIGLVAESAGPTSLFGELFLYGLFKLDIGWRMITVHKNEILIIDAEETAILPEAVELVTGSGAYAPPKYKKIPELAKLEPTDVNSYVSVRFVNAYGALTRGFGASQWTSLLTANYKLELVHFMPVNSSSELKPLLNSLNLSDYPPTLIFPPTLNNRISDALYLTSSSWIQPLE